MWFIGLYLSYAAGILKSVVEIDFYVWCSENLNYTYVENVLLVRSTVLLIRHMEDIILGYRLVLRQLHCRLKHDNFHKYHPN